jgi:menaquinone-9 beta-reductase
MPRARDVCIVGGGPAGLAAAIALAQRGFAVQVVDSARPPIDKACGEGLMPDALDALRALGIELPPATGAPFRGIRFVDAAHSVSADFITGPGIAVRRTILHRLLMERAEAAGVSLWWGAKHVHLAPGGVSINGTISKAQYVIGADGQNSAIRRQAGLDHHVRERRRFGFRRHYRVPAWSTYMDLHWGPDCQIYVSAVGQDELCVTLIGSKPNVRLEDALHYFPALRERLRRATPVSTERGGLSVSRTLRRVARGHIALIGDASGSVDAITGEGVCVSLKQALALAGALAMGDLNTYERSHRALLRRPRLMSRVLLAMGSHARLLHLAVKALRKQPRVFESLLSFHMGSGLAR